jgi:hypothetical protein
MRIKSTDDRCEVRKGGGALMLFGLPFALFGGALIVGGVHQIIKGELDGFVVVPFASIFFLIGIGVMFGRAGVEIDRRAGTVQTWWGMFFPWRRKTLNLEGFSEVHVCKEVRRTSNSNGGSSSKTVYPVRLIGDDQVNIQEYSSSLPARKVAEEVAKIAQIPMRNSITGVDVVRAPHQLDWSLRQHLHESGTVLEEPDVPAGLKVASKDDAWRVELKSGTWLALIGLGMLIIPFMALPIFFIAFAGGKAIGDGLPVALAFFFGVPFLIALIAFMSKAVNGHILEVSPQRVRVTTKRIIGKSIKEFDTEKLEELTVSKSPLAAIFGALGAGGVTLVTDDVFVTVGAGRPEQELDYVHDLICYVVSQ